MRCSSWEAHSGARQLGQRQMVPFARASQEHGIKPHAASLKQVCRTQFSGRSVRNRQREGDRRTHTTHIGTEQKFVHWAQPGRGCRGERCRAVVLRHVVCGPAAWVRTHIGPQWGVRQAGTRASEDKRCSNRLHVYCPVLKPALRDRTRPHAGQQSRPPHLVVAGAFACGCCSRAVVTGSGGARLPCLLGCATTPTDALGRRLENKGCGHRTGCGVLRSTTSGAQSSFREPNGPRIKGMAPSGSWLLQASPHTRRAA